MGKMYAFSIYIVQRAQNSNLGVLIICLFFYEEDAPILLKEEKV